MRPVPCATSWSSWSFSGFDGPLWPCACAPVTAAIWCVFVRWFGSDVPKPRRQLQRCRRDGQQTARRQPETHLALYRPVKAAPRSLTWHGEIWSTLPDRTRWMPSRPCRRPMSLLVRPRLERPRFNRLPEHRLPCLGACPLAFNRWLAPHRSARVGCQGED